MMRILELLRKLNFVSLLDYFVSSKELENRQTFSYTKGLFSFIWNFVCLQKWRFLGIFVSSLAWSIEATLWPYFLRLIINVFTQYDQNRLSAWSELKWLVVLSASLWVFTKMSFRFRDFLRATAIPKLEADVRMTMFNHIQHHSSRYFNEHLAGSCANKIHDMVTQVPLILQHFTLFLSVLSTCLLSFWFFCSVNAIFACILAIWIVVHFAISLSFIKKCACYSNLHGEARSSLAGKIIDSLSNHFTVNLYSNFQYEFNKIHSYQKEEQKKNYEAKRYVALMFFYLSIVFVAGTFSLNGLVIFHWFQGKISSGETIQLFNTTWNMVFIIWFCCEMLPQFFQALGIAQQAYTVMQDPCDVVDLPHEAALSVKRGEIIFENVTFNYGGKKLFENKSIHIKGGEKVGLVGVSGAGKSSFVNLILRMHSVQKGKIFIDGQDISQITVSSLRKQIALIPQDPILFNRSIVENISYSSPEASFEEIVYAAKLAHCEGFIRNCQASYATIIGEKGAQLSGGERQRIALARALLRGAPILILDEATSALDLLTEQTIQDSLESFMKGRTTIVIDHRLPTLVKMDRILVFDQGKIIEEGSHGELLSQEGLYAKMWRLQHPSIEMVK